MLTREVHPHARGEQLMSAAVLAGFEGSSPRSWGTVTMALQESELDRFIPTLVGNRLPALRLRVNDTVHPHARGEQSKKKSLRINGLLASEILPTIFLKNGWMNRSSI